MPISALPASRRGPARLPIPPSLAPPSLVARSSLLGPGGAAPRRLAFSGSDRDAGNAALELVVLAPVILFLLGLMIAAGRTSIAQGAVDAAARDAARQASISLTPGAARAAALSSARAALSEDGLDCNPVVTVDTSQFTTVGVGLPAQVTATVWCRVPLADLVVPGMPGSRLLSYTFTSPLDPFRER